jgi:hypothetical protein
MVRFGSLLGGGILVVFLTSITTSQTHFTFTSNTGNDATVAIPTNANPNINGTPLASGDEIGAFTPAGLCVGAVVWSGTNTALTVWGDNDLTPTIDGMAASEQISYRVWDLSSNTEYATVNVTYSQGNGNYSANALYVLSSLSAVAPPTAPVLTSPSNGATGAAINPTLGWNASTGAASYGLQVSTSSSFSSTVVNQTGITTTSYAASGLANNTTYYWRVNATNAGGTSAWSSSRSFTTIVAAPSAPTLSSPTNGATGAAINPTLGWNASTGAASYGLQVSTSSSFSSTVVNQTGITTTSYAASGLANNTTYYWRVNATNAGGTSAYSASWSFTTNVSQSIVLPQGWNMISSVVQPRDSTLDTLLAKIIPHMVLMKNGAGEVFWPAQSINAIGNWNYREGYQLYMQSADTLTVPGSEVVPQTTSLSLTQGVNLVSYLRYSAMRADSALVSIQSSLLIAKNNAGEVYWPAYGINAIGSLKPGQGYQLQVTQAATLTYPANAGPFPPSLLTKSLATVQFMDVPAPVHYVTSVSNSGNNAVLLLEASGLKEGDEIAIWSGSRKLLGSGVISQRKALITIWGDDKTTEHVTEGAREGEPLFLTVWSVEEHSERSLAPSTISDALNGTTSAEPLRYKANAVWIAHTMENTEIPKTFTLWQNYPNPFNPSSTIRYGLPQDAMTTLEVFNILGQRVAVLVNEGQKAGYHEAIFQNKGLGSGIYFYRLTAGKFLETKKMTLLR